ncbi:MAG: hypothetical protein ABFR53_13265, partial [Actinomycetota bacterium]
SARTQAQWIIVVSPSDLAALGHLPHSVREGKKPSALRSPRRIVQQVPAECGLPSVFCVLCSDFC